MFFEYFKLASRSLVKRKKRAFLTMLGIFVGIAAVVALVSLGQGLQGAINAQFEKVGADKIMIQAKDPTFVGENVPGAMTDREISIVDRVSGVVEVAGVVFRGINVLFNDVQRTVFLMVLPDNKQETSLVYAFSTWEVLEGREVSYNDKNKVAVGYNLAHNNLFNDDIVVGNKILLNGSTYDVVGVFKKTGDIGLDNSVVVSGLLFDSYNYLVAQVVGNPDKVGDDIEKAIRRDRHQKEGKEDFNVQTSSDLIASFNSVLNIIQVVFVGIALISLLVGGIGIMNVMFTSVLERTREIGVMKAIGARNNSILMLFLIESGILGLVGGLVGVLIGAGISKSVELGANYAFGAGTIVAAFPLWLIIGALAFSFVIGAVSGVLPARRASKLKPVDALRWE